MQKNGFTLVELLVGLGVSSILMLTMLAYFKQVGTIGVESAESADYEIQLDIGLLSVQKMVQFAGYGLGQESDIQVGQYNGESAVYWRYLEALPDPNAAPTAPLPAVICRGVGSSVAQQNGKYKNTLILLTADDCDAGDLTDATWRVQQSVVSLVSDQSYSVFAFTSQATPCSPFGVGQTMGAVVLKIRGLRKYDYGDGNYYKNRNICINNINNT